MYTNSARASDEILCSQLPGFPHGKICSMLADFFNSLSIASNVSLISKTCSRTWFENRKSNFSLNVRSLDNSKKCKSGCLLLALEIAFALMSVPKTSHDGSAFFMMSAPTPFPQPKSVHSQTLATPILWLVRKSFVSFLSPSRPYIRENIYYRKIAWIPQNLLELWAWAFFGT